MQRLSAIAAICTFAAFSADTSYYRDVRPVIQRNCQGCHQPNLKSSDLDLTTYEGLKAGGKRGVPFKPGQPGESLLLKYITGEPKPQRPRGQPPLPAEQIEIVRNWITAGATDDTPAEARD